MQTLRIFISSPGDVAEERDQAKRVIVDLQGYYDDQATLIPVLWEDLAIPATASFQEGIDLVLSERHRIDIAVFILWARLGSELSDVLTRPDGSPYRSGTEREFDLMLGVFEQSGGKIPLILAYTRDDEKSFSERLDTRTQGQDDLYELIRQRELVKQFISERFQDKDGHNIRAYHSYREPVGFAQRLHVHLRQALDELLKLNSAPVTWSGAPYRSLEVFDIQHAPIFFGRDEETCDLLDRLRDQRQKGCAFACIVGASGAGKSSMARAGVAARLLQRSFDEEVREWRAAVIQPSLAGGDLFLHLAHVLGESVPELREGTGIGRLAERLKGNHEAATDLLEGAFKMANAKIVSSSNVDITDPAHPVPSLRLLLVFDQMEELWTDTALTATAREKFLVTIEFLARCGPISVLATIRSDFYPQAQLSEAFLRMKSERGHYDLTPPGAAALRDLIVQPARRAGLTFERDPRTNRTLDQRILEEADRDASSLPLLQYALAELYERRDAGKHLLTFAAYEAMGGVVGALTQRAETVLQSLSVEAQAALKELLPLLVSINFSGDQKMVRRRTPVADLTTTPAREVLTQKLIDLRFLVVDAAGDGTPTLMLAHEALLKYWKPLQSWVAANKDLLHIRAHVETAAADWQREQRQAGGSPDDLLLADGLPLSRGEYALTAGLLGKNETEFVRRSLAKNQRVQLGKRRRLQGLVIASVLAAVVLGIVALQAARKSLQVQNLLAESDYERAERLFGEDNAASALWYLSRAVASGAASERASERYWFALSQRSWPRPVTDSLPFSSDLLAMTFDPSGSRFATGTRDGGVTLFSASDGKPLGPALAHPKAVRGLQFSPDGKRLLTGCNDAVARLWSVDTLPVKLIKSVAHDDMVAGIAWSPDGRFFATASWDKRVRVWDAAESAPEVAIFTAEMKDKVHTVAFDPHKPGRVLGVAKDEVCIWDFQSLKNDFRYQALSDLNGAAFSPDGSKLLSFSNQGDVTLSDLTDGTQQWAQITLGETCDHAVFAPDGKTIALASGKRVSVYGADQIHDIMWEASFPDRITVLKYTTEGKRLLVACGNGRVEVRDSAGRRLCEPIVEPGIPIALDFHRDLDRVLCARSTHSVRLWALAPARPEFAIACELGAQPLLLQSRGAVYAVAENGQAAILAPAPGTNGHALAPAVRLRSFAAKLRSAAVAPAGDFLLAGTIDGRLLSLPAGSGEGPKQETKEDAGISELVFSRQGDIVAAAADSGRINLWRWPGMNAIPYSSLHSDRITALSLLESPTRVLSAAWDRKIVMAGTAAGQTPKQWPITAEPQAVASTPSGELSAVILTNGEVWLASGPEASCMRLAVSMTGAPSCIAMNSTGDLIAVGSIVGRVTLFNTRSQTKIAELNCGDACINSLSFGRDDQWLATGAEDGQSRIWEAATGHAITESLPHASPVRLVLLDPKGLRLISAERSGRVVIWPLARPTDHRALQSTAHRLMDAAGPQAQRVMPTMDLLENILPTPQ